jgi:hypothetical protein
VTDPVQPRTVRERVLDSARELVVIVPGVLIALWIGDLWQERIDRKAEAVYLERLRAVMEADLDEVSRVVRHGDRRVEHARRALAFLDAPAAPLDAATIGHFSRAGFITFFAHARSTWDDLLGTGNLVLLRDAGLRRNLEKIVTMTEVEQRVLRSREAGTRDLLARLGSPNPE